MIELQNIQKGFNGRPVIQEVSATLDTGKTNLIIGASGSGKTVLMKCIVGLLQPDEGSVLYDGKDFTRMDPDQKKVMRQQIGMLFQGSALFDSMTVEQNVMFPLHMFSQGTLQEKQKRVDEVLDRVQLRDAHKRFPAEISGGMKKRVGIARAIVLNPKYLFCDEPNSGLDPQTSLVIDKLIREITTEFNITTVVNTHDMNSVLEIGDKILFLYKGKKWWEGNVDDILRTDNTEINDFIFASKLAKAIKKV